MGKENRSIVQRAESYVERILKTGLSENLHYHDLIHTQQVVAAVEEITQNEGFSQKEAEMVILAAWFHDTGYLLDVADHEKYSQEIAIDWLTDQKYPKERIQSIINCIEATRCPQNPTNKLEQAICDADMYHLSTSLYFDRSEKLKSELEHYFNIHHTWKEWKIINQEFFAKHCYFTSYGKRVLTPRKELVFAKLMALKSSTIPVSA